MYLDHLLSWVRFTAMSLSPGKVNTIVGETELTLRVRNLETLHSLVKEICSTPGLPGKIKCVDIVSHDDDEEEEEEESNMNTTTTPLKLPSSTREERRLAREATEEAGRNLAPRLCAPLIRILDAISNTGSLQRFAWTASSTSSPFTRPPSFWTALYAHTSSLQHLSLDYFEHEVRHLPSPPSSLPNLTSLQLNAVSAHGDNGSAIEAFLCACPALQSLDFTWPGCDLLSCQIQGISWTYTFPALRSLSLSGWDFAPAALSDFLHRHDGVRVFSDGIDREGEDEESESDVFPALTHLRKKRGPAVGVLKYFNSDVRRPIKMLAMEINYNSVSALRELASLESVRSVKVLELHGEVRDWRPKEVYPDSSDDEDEAFPEPEKPRVMDMLKECLGAFTGLEELGIGMESGDVMYRRPDGVLGSPDPATGEDLRFFLEKVLLTTTKIRTLRLWDMRGEALAQELLDDFPDVPESLERVVWEGKEKVLYSIERGNRVRAVALKTQRRVVNENSEGDAWVRQRAWMVGSSDS